MNPLFRVALSSDFYTGGQLIYPDFDLSSLDRVEGMEHYAIEDPREEIGSDQLAGANGVILLAPSLTRGSLADSENLIAACRFGVGYEKVDVEACTDADVAFMITKGAVDRPVAEATVGWMIALSHHVRAKDQLAREGQWEGRENLMGSELRNRVLGIIGFGGIGRELARLLSGFGMHRPLVFDPYVDHDAASEAGVDKVELDFLLSKSDFVSIHCPLTASTRNLISSRELSLMKPTAYLLNTARGSIVNEDDLHRALSEKRIAGAALDCFEQEPSTEPSRFSGFDNVLLAPHSIAWTHELFGDIGHLACQTMIDMAHGKRPHGVVNSEVFDKPSFQAKWSRIALNA